MYSMPVGSKKKPPGVYNGGFLKKSFDNIRFRWIARFTGGTVQGTHQTVKIPTRTKCEDISGRLKKKKSVRKVVIPVWYTYVG